MSMILECSDVAKNFDGFRAAKGISLSLAEGEIVGVIGANGAGKTTLLNIISGYLTPNAGHIRLRGIDITGWTPRRIKRQGVGRSFQIPQVFGGNSALENIMIAQAAAFDRAGTWLRPFSDQLRVEAALSLMESFELRDFRDAPAQEMPHGVRKLVDIAIALVAQPQLVLLDEPTSGVSGDEKDKVMLKLWRKFRAEDTTVLFIEHDMDIVERYADRVVALYEGEVIASGSPAQVLNEEAVVRLISGKRPVREACRA